MITVRRSSERRHDKAGGNSAWRTFDPSDGTGDFGGGFGALQSLDESRVRHTANSVRQRHREGDVVTYVREGSLAYANSMGQSGVVHAGEFHRMTAASQVHHRETGASHLDSAHVFQIVLRGAEEADPEPSYEQKRFSVAERRDGLRIIASPDARRGSLHLHQDVLVYSAILHSGQHVVHELPVGRSAWLHVVQGEAIIGDLVLTTGDGAGVTAERAVALIAHMDCEILLVDVEHHP